MNSMNINRKQHIRSSRQPIFTELLSRVCVYIIKGTIIKDDTNNWETKKIRSMK